MYIKEFKEDFSNPDLLDEMQVESNVDFEQPATERKLLDEHFTERIERKSERKEIVRDDISMKLQEAITQMQEQIEVFQA